MKKYRNMIVLWLVAVFLIVGCNKEDAVQDTPNNGEDVKIDNEVDKKPNPPVNNDPAELVFYSENGMPIEEFDKKYGDSIRKKFPHYTIEYMQYVGEGTDVGSLIAANTRWDIHFANTGRYEREVITHGAQFDMTELLKKHDVDINRIDPSMTNGVRTSSYGFYALPVFTDTMAVYYNKDIFEKFGVTHPTDGMNWEELYDLANSLSRTDGDNTYIGFAHYADYTIFMNPLSLPAVDESGVPTINSNEGWRKLFQTLFIGPSEIAGVRDYLRTSPTHVVNGFFETMEIAMEPMVSISTSDRENLKVFDWDWIAAPTFKDIPGVGYQPYTHYFGITQMAKDKDAAMQVLKYLISDEFQLDASKRGYMPVLADENVRKAFGSETIFKDRNWGAFFYNKMAPTVYRGIHDAMVINIYATYANQIMKGEIDLNTALRKAEEEATQYIRDQMQQ